MTIVIRFRTQRPSRRLLTGRDYLLLSDSVFRGARQRRCPIDAIPGFLHILKESL